MNLTGRQSMNVIDARVQHSTPLSEQARVLQFVRQEATPLQAVEVVTYAALRDHKAEIGLFVVFAVFFALVLRDLCRLSRMLRRRLSEGGKP